MAKIFCPHTIEFTTSTIDGYYNSDLSGLVEQDSGFVSVKLYDGSHNQIANQLAANISCVTTVIDFMPSYDFIPLGGALYQSTTPGGDVRVWRIQAPGLLNVKTSQGGANLKYLGVGAVLNFEMDDPQVVLYNGGVGTNKIRHILKHGIGVKHSAMVTMNLLKII